MCAPYLGKAVGLEELSASTVGAVEEPLVDVKDPTVSFSKSGQVIACISNKLQIPANFRRTSGLAKQFVKGLNQKPKGSPANPTTMWEQPEPLK